MKGKLISIAILLSALIAGGVLYYMQIYGFYRDVPATDGQDVMLMSLTSEQPEVIAYSDFTAIDADSSPIRYRACFTTTHSNAMLSETYMLFEDMVPRNAPGWFDCFDAAAIGAALEDGSALTYLSAKNISYGVDRIVAIFDDGRGFVWHELNDCGHKAYDGTVTGEACPTRETDD